MAVNAVLSVQCQPFTLDTHATCSRLQFGDGFNATIGGVLRGAGRQELGALLNLLSYWSVGSWLVGALSGLAGV